MRKESRLDRKDPYEITAVVVRRARLGEVSGGQAVNAVGRANLRTGTWRRQVPIETLN